MADRFNANKGPIPDYDFWAVEGTDGPLSHTDLGDALDDFIDTHFGYDGEGKHGQLSPFPTHILMEGWVRKKMEASVGSIADSLREHFLDWFEEDYGNPEEETEIPAEIDKAFRKCAKVVIKHWPIWGCTPTETFDVDLKKWVQDHHPDLEDCDWEEED